MSSTHPLPIKKTLSHRQNRSTIAGTIITTIAGPGGADGVFGEGSAVGTGAMAGGAFVAIAGVFGSGFGPNKWSC